MERPNLNPIISVREYRTMVDRNEAARLWAEEMERQSNVKKWEDETGITARNEAIKAFNARLKK